MGSKDPSTSVFGYDEPKILFSEKSLLFVIAEP